MTTGSGSNDGRSASGRPNHIATVLVAGFLLCACGAKGREGGWKSMSDASPRVGPVLPTSTSVDVGGAVAMDFVLVQAGAFSMSSDDDLPNPAPPKKVEVEKPFYLARYETTQAQWQAVMGTNPSEFKGSNLPVENVSWNDCRSFLARLNARTPGAAFDLPTEAQWEYACRAGSTTTWCMGNDESCVAQCAWFVGDSGFTTHPVGEKKPNSWGLHDMHGNVWEWCADAVTDECGDGPSRAGEGANRVFRGGSWYFTAAGARSGSRGWGDAANLRRSTVGFRVAMAVPQ